MFEVVAGLEGVETDEVNLDFINGFSVFTEFEFKMLVWGVSSVLISISFSV